MTHKSEQKNDVSRRKFLQGGAVLGAAVGLSSLTGGKATEEVAKSYRKKRIRCIPT